MPLDHTARGVFPIAPTPFHADGRVDLASVDRMTDFYVETGATGLTVLGVMGGRRSSTAARRWTWRSVSGERVADSSSSPSGA